MADSDSSLSSPPATDDELTVEMSPAETEPVSSNKKKKKKKKKNANILTFFKHRSPSPPPRRRPASPPHEFVPEDNSQIAFIVMFRSRFDEAFPRGAPTVGPQDIEQGTAEELPSSEVEGLLCALLGLVLNRKKPIEKGHYGRALEEAIQTQKSQWPPQWTVSPISGGRSFNTMTALERITLLHTLTLWSLNQNEQVKSMINNAYKSRTTKDRLDTNIPLSVQPWGRDGDKRRYWLVEGQNDTHFRVYRESDPKLEGVKWISVAGSIRELQELAKKLEEDEGHKEAKALADRMVNAVLRLETSEGKRKRREYRVQRNAAFTRPEPGFSLYEGRTRGKRLRYTFSEEEDFDSDNPSRRSGRQSGRETSVIPSGPTVTASGRQVRCRATGVYGETLHSGQVTDRPSPATAEYQSDASEGQEQSRVHERPARSTMNGRALHRSLNSDDEDDATSWDGGDEDEDEIDQMELGDLEEDEEDTFVEEEEPQSLVVTLRYGKGAFTPPITSTPSIQSNIMGQVSNTNSQPAYSVSVSTTGQALQSPSDNLAPAIPYSPSLPRSTIDPISNGVFIPQQSPVTTVAQNKAAVTKSLPVLDVVLSTSPTYVNMSDATQIMKQSNVGNSEAQVSQAQSTPFSPTSLPPPTPASSWQ